MKKVLATILAITALSASAQHDPWRYANQRAYPMHRHPQTVIVERNGDWAGPMIGGIILGTILTEAARRNAEAQQAPAPQPQPQVIIERQPMPSVTCSEWREVIENGRVYRERTCTR